LHVLTEVLSSGLLLAQPVHDWGGAPPWAGRNGGFWGPWMLAPFFFWVGLIGLVAWIVTRLFPRRGGGSGTGAPNRDPAEEILRERFARGEITEAEYLRSLEILRGEALLDEGATAPRDPGSPCDRRDEIG
jgi:putative membrane protein